ncbi:aminopeptidase P [Reticulomyxa filosa]|uniref:Aminopeptidase P n=1 Tax=Reticulomyxa filosa TaxID=46433 RepID=X6P7U2_RETFI|nr:aminopeptidase P [Reticulomyxa filosa]|eukprot:ETO34256.1 aminopeptidase P [Reticulomyxa filosa]
MMSHDVPHDYRPDAAFLYLTGLKEPSSLAVFLKDSIGHCEYVLFVQRRLESELTWSGHLCGLDGATKVFGANRSFHWDEDQVELAAMIDNCDIVYYEPRTNSSMELALQHVLEKVGIVLLSNDILLQINAMKATLCTIYFCLFVCVNGSITLDNRPIAHSFFFFFKSSVKVNCLCFFRTTTISVSTTNLLFVLGWGLEIKKTMQYCQASIMERELAVKFEMSCRLQGADRISYLCASASHSNGTLLHYFHNDALLSNGDLVLIDCGAEYHCYSSGLFINLPIPFFFFKKKNQMEKMLTFPVSGKFTEVQRVLYEMVLDVSYQLIDMCRPGSSIMKLEKVACRLLKNGLKKLGAIPTLSDSQLKELKLTSSSVHFVGLVLNCTLFTYTHTDTSHMYIHTQHCFVLFFFL